MFFSRCVSPFSSALSSSSLLLFRFNFFPYSLFLSLLISLISRDDARTNISSQRPRPGSGGIEKRTPSAHSFINIYPHLNPSGTVSSPSLPSLLSPFFSTFFFLSLSLSLSLSSVFAPTPYLRGRTPGRVFVLANLLYVSYTDLHP